MKSPDNRNGLSLVTTLANMALTVANKNSQGKYSCLEPNCFKLFNTKYELQNHLHLDRFRKWCWCGSNYRYDRGLVSHVDAKGHQLFASSSFEFVERDTDDEEAFPEDSEDLNFTSDDEDRVSVVSETTLINKMISPVKSLPKSAFCIDLCDVLMKEETLQLPPFDSEDLINMKILSSNSESNKKMKNLRWISVGDYRFEYEQGQGEKTVTFYPTRDFLEAKLLSIFKSNWRKIPKYSSVERYLSRRCFQFHISEDQLLMKPRLEFLCPFTDCLIVTKSLRDLQIHFIEWHKQYMVCPLCQLKIYRRFKYLKEHLLKCRSNYPQTYEELVKNGEQTQKEHSYCLVSKDSERTLSVKSSDILLESNSVPINFEEKRLEIQPQRIPFQSIENTMNQPQLPLKRESKFTQTPTNNDSQPEKVTTVTDTLPSLPPLPSKTKRPIPDLLPISNLKPSISETCEATSKRQKLDNFLETLSTLPPDTLLASLLKFDNAQLLAYLDFFLDNCFHLDENFKVVCMALGLKKMQLEIVEIIENQRFDRSNDEVLFSGLIAAGLEPKMAAEVTSKCVKRDVAVHMVSLFDM